MQEVLATDSTDAVNDEDLQTMYLSAAMTDVGPLWCCVSLSMVCVSQRLVSSYSVPSLRSHGIPLSVAHLLQLRHHQLLGQKSRKQRDHRGWSSLSPGTCYLSTCDTTVLVAGKSSDLSSAGLQVFPQSVQHSGARGDTIRIRPTAAAKDQKKTVSDAPNRQWSGGGVKSAPEPSPLH